MRYRDPAYGPDFIFPAVRLPGAESPPNVLKPQDLDPRQNREWRPRMGFGERRDRGNLGQAGHRMLGHHVPRYGAVPPPIQVKRSSTRLRTDTGVPQSHASDQVQILIPGKLSRIVIL